MRRKDREMNRDFGLQVIDQAQYGVLSLPEGDGLAYGIPLSIAREGAPFTSIPPKAGKRRS